MSVVLLFGAYFVSISDFLNSQQISRRLVEVYQLFFLRPEAPQPRLNIATLRPKTPIKSSEGGKGAADM